MMKPDEILWCLMKWEPHENDLIARVKAATVKNKNRLHKFNEIGSQFSLAGEHG